MPASTSPSFTALASRRGCCRRIYAVVDLSPASHSGSGLLALGPRGRRSRSLGSRRRWGRSRPGPAHSGSAKSRIDSGMSASVSEPVLYICDGGAGQDAGPVARAGGRTASGMGRGRAPRLPVRTGRRCRRCSSRASSRSGTRRPGDSSPSGPPAGWRARGLLPLRSSTSKPGLLLEERHDPVNQLLVLGVVDQPGPGRRAGRSPPAGEPRAAGWRRADGRDTLGDGHPSRLLRAGLTLADRYFRARGLRPRPPVNKR